MIKGHFAFALDYLQEHNRSSISFDFLQCNVYLSEYGYKLKGVSVNFLVRKKGNNFFEEIFNRERLGEMHSFPSSLSLLKDPSIRQRLFAAATILIVYDEVREEISIVRDTFATIPLYYSASTLGFRFSTDLNYLLNRKELPNAYEINPDKISSYLTRNSSGTAYNAETFYKNISAVLPGHFVHCSANELISGSVISFHPEKWSHLTKIEEFGEEFRYLFKESVRQNIQGHTNISAHLSGGLDSSSVSSTLRNIASNLNFNTLYSDTNTESTNESHYASQVATAIQSNHFVIHPSTDDFDLLLKNTATYGFPEHMALGLSLPGGLIDKAQELGSDILLTGNDGDSIVGHGFNYLDQLYVEKNWHELKLALSQNASISNGLGKSKERDSISKTQKERRSFLNFLYQKLTRVSSVPQALELLAVAKSNFGISSQEFSRKGLTGIKNRIIYFNRLPDTIISEQLLLQTTSPPIVHGPVLLGDLPDKYNFAFSDVFNIQAMALNEEMFYLSREKNIESGYPFYNSSLYELCMAVPTHLKFDHGKGRGHLREGMKGILIDSVRNRTDKGVFNDYVRNAAIRMYYAARDFLADSNAVWQYVDKLQFERCVKLFLSDSQPFYVHNRTTLFVTRTIFLSVWLNQQRG